MCVCVCVCTFEYEFNPRLGSGEINDTEYHDMRTISNTYKAPTNVLQSIGSESTKNQPLVCRLIIIISCPIDLSISSEENSGFERFIVTTG